MAAITFSAMHLANSAAETMRDLLRTFGAAVDAFAVYRMKHAVPEHELRRAERQIDRYRRMMQASCDKAGR
jgi:hypothetical protein